ncbi:conserved hypothetical protein [Sporisorium reilianum SRZ2]|uniref:Flavin reductase like domain-containing protein n=1 Tax=Sporisorium reilianum (strain SRZ2) TaxID=999809 RepID=E6ZVK4_SPORE|nr:conserved hypothetical protein [Sporisorium reilianum SRZ2]
MTLLLPYTLSAARATTSKVTLEAFLPFTRRSCHPRRPFTRSALRSQQHDGDDTSAQIRALMRESAQPVALATTFLPSSGKARQIHAATLSSFTSVSLDPHLVCFALRTPSRLADALAAHVERRAREVDLVINVLSTQHARLAAAYAVPGTPPLTYPCPAEAGAEAHPLLQAGLVDGEEEGAVPLVANAIGALACQVVDSIELDRYSLTHPPTEEDTHAKSRLYIARVVHVHAARAPHALKPLLYRRQTFVSATDDSLL